MVCTVRKRDKEREGLPEGARGREGRDRQASHLVTVVRSLADVDWERKIVTDHKESFIDAKIWIRLRPVWVNVEPLIKDTLNKGHLCIKDTFQCTNLYSGNTFLPLKEDNLSVMDKMIRPNVSVI